MNGLQKDGCRMGQNLYNQQGAGKTNIQVLISSSRACSRTRNLEWAKQIHQEAVKCGHDCIYVVNALINMYVKCGSMVDARDLFDSTNFPDVVSWTTLILGYADNGQSRTALDMFIRMREEGPSPDSVTLVAALKACTSLAVLGNSLWEDCRDMGKGIHSLSVENDYGYDVYIQSTLINTYAKCGSITDARQVFDSMKHPTVVSWNVLILGYVDNGQGYTALDLFSKMRTEGLAPDPVTFLAALKACTYVNVKEECRENCKQIHNISEESGCKSNVFLQSNLVDLLSKCGSMEYAREVFDCMKHPTVVSWSALILGYAENGQALFAMDMFCRMRTEGPDFNSLTLVAALKSCACLALKEGASRWGECSDRGKGIHSLTVEYGYISDAYVQNILVDMYVKCGFLAEAREVFDGIKQPTVVSWTVLVLGYAEKGEGRNSLNLFTRMRIEGPSPDFITLVAAIKACTSLAKGDQLEECRDIGRQIHNLSVEHGCNSDAYVQSTMIDMYGKCGSMVDAREVFEFMKHPTTVSWNVLILGYAGNSQGRIALDMFIRMRSKGPECNSLTLVAALKACISIAEKEGTSQWAECKDLARVLCNISFQNGWNSDVYFESTLVDMYGKCGSMVDAHELFDGIKHPTIVSWNVLILGYVDNAQSYNALYLFSRMTDAPDSVTLGAALKACTALAANEGTGRWEKCKDRGKQLHSIAVESGCSSDVCVQNNLVDMFVKCGSMVDAREVFDGMKYPVVMSWTVLILGYADNGQSQTALDLFFRMRIEGLVLDSVLYGAVLKACGSVGALELGRTIHLELTSGKYLDVILVTRLVDFYAKCGSLIEAQSVFYQHNRTRDIMTWNALISGFSNCGDSESLFQLFREMQDANFKPDGITFLYILTCCSHRGLLVEGKECFDSMFTKYNVIPNVKHYTCMIDLYGRANKLDDAMALLESMSCSPDDVTWMSILGSCCKWKNVEIGRIAFEALIHLNDKDSAAYVLMRQIW